MVGGHAHVLRGTQTRRAANVLGGLFVLHQTVIQPSIKLHRGGASFSNSYGFQENMDQILQLIDYP